MLCIRWTMRNACVKKLIKNNLFFLLKLMNTNVRISQNFNYKKKKMKILKFWWIFHFLEGGGFVVKLVAAKVICQHMIFSTLSFSLCNNLWKIKGMIGFSQWKSWSIAKYYTIILLLYYQVLVYQQEGHDECN